MSSIGSILKVPSLAIIAGVITLLISACISPGQPTPAAPAAPVPPQVEPDQGVELEVIIDPPEGAKFLVNPKPDGNGRFARGTTVTVDVSVNPDWKIKKWVGPWGVVTGSRGNVNMDQNQTVSVELEREETPTNTPSAALAPAPTAMPPPPIQMPTSTPVPPQEPTSTPVPPPEPTNTPVPPAPTATPEPTATPIPTTVPSRNVVTFDGLDTSIRTCISSRSYTIGEEVSTQFESLGVIFSVNEFAVAYGSSTSIVGGDTGVSGDPILTVNTIDNATNRCPGGRTSGNNGALIANFVDPVSMGSRTVSNVSVHVSDTALSVHVRTLNASGEVIHECANVFSRCPFVMRSLPFSVGLLFPGGGIAKIEFIDEDEAGRADGFTLDDLAFDLM